MNLDEDDLDSFLYGGGGGDGSGPGDSNTTTEQPLPSHTHSHSGMQEMPDLELEAPINNTSLEVTEMMDKQPENTMTVKVGDEEEEEEGEEEEDIEIVIDASANKALEKSKLTVSNSQKTEGMPIEQMMDDLSTTHARAVDLDAVADYKGRPIYELELETMEERPWRKPGADLTDYFNYGFDEHTWRAYCLRQNQLRSERNLRSRMNVFDPDSMAAAGLNIPPMGMNPHFLPLLRGSSSGVGGGGGGGGKHSRNVEDSDQTDHSTFGTKSTNGRENSGMGDYNAAAAAALSMNMFSDPSMAAAAGFPPFFMGLSNPAAAAAAAANFMAMRNIGGGGNGGSGAGGGTTGGPAGSQSGSKPRPSSPLLNVPTGPRAGPDKDTNRASPSTHRHRTQDDTASGSGGGGGSVERGGGGGKRSTLSRYHDRDKPSPLRSTERRSPSIQGTSRQEKPIDRSHRGDIGRKDREERVRERDEKTEVKSSGAPISTDRDRDYDKRHDRRGDRDSRKRSSAEADMDYHHRRRGRH